MKTIKRITALVLCLALAVVLLPSVSLTAHAACSGNCGAQGDNLTWTFDPDTGLLTIKGNGAMADYDFNSPWYDFSQSIKAVLLENGVTHIGESAFFYCTALASVTIPGSVKSIGNDAFQQCTALPSIEIPASVTSIGDRAFSQCALTSVSIPKSVKDMGYLAFAFNPLTAINVAPNNPSFCSVDGVLYNKAKTELILYPRAKTNTSYQIPDGVNSIASDAFSYGTNLIEVTIPDSVEFIGSYAFFGCSSLTDIRIPDGVWQIGTLTFAHCTALKSVTIGNSVNIIGCEAFSGCESLTSLVIPDSVTFIDGWAFDNCSALTDVTIGKNLQRTGAGIFGQCSSLTSVTIPDSMTQIKLQTFYNCVSLTSVIIPDSVTEIDQSAFEGVPVSGLTIFGAEGSAAQTYAEENGFQFVRFPFVDVDLNDFFFNPVLWAVDNNVTGGVDDTHFAPERTVMRSDAMVFFWAANGRPEFTAIDKTFRDVKETHWAYKAVMWAVENGITGGTNTAGTEFSPSRTCSRSEILQFLYAAMGKPGYSIQNPYSDINTAQWYYEGAIWAYENGLEKGEDGKYNAKTPCTRGYVVTYLYRYFTGLELAE